MNTVRVALSWCGLVLFGAVAAGAQELDEVCPNSKDTGALTGIVLDADGEMALPGATVRATWELAGKRGRAEVQSALDGSFTMCYLPLGTPLAVQARLGTMEGAAMPLTLVEPVTRHDVGFAMIAATSGAATGADRIWACIGTPDSQLRVQLGGLVRCDPQWPQLERCPKEELGRVSASITTQRRGVMRELVDMLIDEAKRLGANALINVSGERGSMSAMAVKIEVDPATC